MKTASGIATDWLKSLARKTLPYTARRWIRDELERISQKRQELHDRIIVRKLEFTNKEGFVNFNFRLMANHRQQGVSAMLRVKNEESKIYHCLKSIYNVFDEIVLVDNGSTDRTLQIVREFKTAADKDEKIKIYFYPFDIARCGDEHYGTPENSVHNLAYYYNWTLSKCSRSYVCKWDGDMVLRRDVRESFRGFLERIQKSRKMCWAIYGQAVYRDLASNHFLARGEINGEIRIFPNGLNPRFYKMDLFEVLKSHPAMPEAEFGGVTFYELKFTDENEFSHWSITDIPTDRKKRELENSRLVRKNAISSATFEKLTPSFLEDQIA